MKENNVYTILPCNPRGIHYRETYVNEQFGYFVYEGIPYLIYRDIHPYSELLYCFYAAIYMCRKTFPTIGIPNFHFSKFRIEFQNHKLNIDSAIEYTKKILSNSVKLPINVKNYKGIDAYIDFNIESDGVDFFEFLKQEKHLYHYLENKLYSSRVDMFYNLFTKTRRQFKIALYYYVRAAMLAQGDFIEEAGINIQLAIEAIIEDYKLFHKINDNKTAAEQIKNNIILPCYHMNVLAEHRDYRNIFLAHFDKNIFTDKQSVNDPDLYCCETFESLAHLLSRYMKHI